MSKDLLKRSEGLEEADLLLTDINYIVTCDSQDRIIKKGAVAIKDGKFAEIGESGTVKSRYHARKILSLENHILMPGLINCHVHAPMSIFRGLSDDLSLDKWLFEVIFPAEAKYVNRDSVYLGSLLSISEMVLGGTTCFCDGYFFEEEVARAGQEVGIRCVAGQGILDFSTPDVKDPGKKFERIEEFLKNLSRYDSNLIKPSVFCHSPYTCSQETLVRAKEISKANDLIFQIHLEETKVEHFDIIRKYGKSPTRMLYDLNVLDEKSLCIHGVWIEGEDVTLLRESGAGVVHCIESNLKLGSGIAPLVSWLEKGIRVTLGTDGPASNNNLSLIEEMSMVAKVHKAIKKDPSVVSAKEVLRLTTLGASEAIGLSSEIGSIEVGKRADCVALFIGEPHLIPLYDPVSHIVYSAKSSDVNFVLVDGNFVVEERRLVRLELRDVLEEVKKFAYSIGRTIC